MTAALVLGGAGCLWDDVRAAMALGRFDGVVACNDAGAVWPGRLDAWVTLHPEKLPAWAAKRAAAGHERASRVLTHHQPRSGRLPEWIDATTEYRFPGQTVTGSSGLFAAKVALVDLGFDRAVLCGVPMAAASGHFFDGRPWDGVASHRQGWKEALPQIRGRLRSVSGWTAELLGTADKEWLGA